MRQKIVLIFFFISIVSNAQKPSDKNIHFDNREAVWVLKQLEQIFDVKFSYAPALLQAKKISIHNHQANLKDILLDNLFISS